MPETSHSRVKFWRRCHRQYHYRYAERLKRKRKAAPLLKGEILHALLDARSMKKNPLAVLETYAKDYKNLFIEEQEMYGDIIGDMRRIYEGYSLEYANDGFEVLASEEFVACDLAGGLRFVGYIDKRVVDKHGRMWLMEHKTGKNIPPAENRYYDLQSLMYVWAFNQTHKTERISGVVWDYIRTKPPTIPQQLKAGGISIAKNITTDHRTFMAAIEEYGLDPLDYSERLDDLKAQESPFYRRITLPNPSQAMIDEIVADFQNTSIELYGLNAVSKARNLCRECSFCEYRDLCDAELRGHDAAFIRKSEFEIREASAHGYQEVSEDVGD